MYPNPCYLIRRKTEGKRFKTEMRLNLLSWCNWFYYWKAAKVLTRDLFAMIRFGNQVLILAKVCVHNWLTVGAQADKDFPSPWLAVWLSLFWLYIIMKFSHRDQNLMKEEIWTRVRQWEKMMTLRNVLIAQYKTMWICSSNLIEKLISHVTISLILLMLMYSINGSSPLIIVTFKLTLATRKIKQPEECN